MSDQVTAAPTGTEVNSKVSDLLEGVSNMATDLIQAVSSMGLIQQVVLGVALFPFVLFLLARCIGPLQRALDGPTGKRWTTMPCLSDHIVILHSHVTALFCAYFGCGGEALDHDYVEAIMVSVNSTIECPYCDGLHTELAALAGNGEEAAKKLAAATDVASATGAVVSGFVPGVAYARQIGELNVRSKGEQEAYDALVRLEGEGRAKSIKALCIFLYWGGMTGNTVNCAKKRLIGVAPLRALTPFSLLFFLYYGPLFFVVYFFNSCVIPAFSCVFGSNTKKQVWFFKLTGLILWLLAFIWIAPLGLFAVVLSIVLPQLRSQIEGQLEKELEMV
jgi:AhpD family alkylhydroperoxidase